MKDNTVTKAEVIITNNSLDNYTGKFFIKVYDLAGEEIAVDAQLIKSLEFDRDQNYKWKDEDKEKLEKENKALREDVTRLIAEKNAFRYAGQDLLNRAVKLWPAVRHFPGNKRRGKEYKELKENWDYINSINNYKQFK